MAVKISLTTFWIVFISFMINTRLFAQEFSNIPPDREKNIIDNYNILVKNADYVNNIISFKKDGIYVKSTQTNKNEFILYYNDIDIFLDMFKYQSMYEIISFYINSEGSKSIELDKNKDLENPDKIKIAIDPGHFAGNYKEAIYEDRYVKILSKDGEEIFINEASLNHDIATLLKYKLENIGYEVLITRKAGSSALGISFDEFVKGEYERALKNMVLNNEIPFQKANTIIQNNDEKEIYNQVYTYLDFRERVKLINEFDPDFTLVVHLNAFEYGGRNGYGYSYLTPHNYSLGFVPGSFMNGELEKPDQRLDFLRLLVSDNIEDSEEIGNKFIGAIKEDLNVHAYSDSIYKSTMIEKSCIATNHDAVYARNLYMTRAVESELFYLEAILQDNHKEFVRLSKKDFSFKDVRTSKRIEELAEVCFQVIHKHYSN